MVWGRELYSFVICRRSGQGSIERRDELNQIATASREFPPKAVDRQPAIRACRRRKPDRPQPDAGNWPLSVLEGSPAAGSS
mgnify:CR=1 FL=1